MTPTPGMFDPWPASAEARLRDLERALTTHAPPLDTASPRELAAWRDEADAVRAALIDQSRRLMAVADAVEAALRDRATEPEALR